jgi:hypothetical protein
MDFHLSQSRLIFSSETFALTAGILVPLIPAALVILLLLKRRDWHPAIAKWRFGIWWTGLVLSAIAALAFPLFLLGLQFLSKTARATWFPDTGTKMLFFAFLLTPIAMILIGFGRGKQRWIGLLSASLSLGVLYVSLLATSY